jgi:hypothetical protein
MEALSSLAEIFDLGGPSTLSQGHKTTRLCILHKKEDNAKLDDLIEAFKKKIAAIGMELKITEN